MAAPSKRDEAEDRMEPFFGTYVRNVRGEANDDETNLADMLADLMHWSAARGISFESALTTAEIHFAEEE